MVIRPPRRLSDVLVFLLQGDSFDSRKVSDRHPSDAHDSRWQHPHMRVRRQYDLALGPNQVARCLPFNAPADTKTDSFQDILVVLVCQRKGTSATLSPLGRIRKLSTCSKTRQPCYNRSLRDHRRCSWASGRNRESVMALC